MKVYRSRIMLIGQDRAGKTSLRKSLLGMPFDPEEQSTVGIEVDPSLFRADVDQVKNWQHTDRKLGVSQFAKELACMVAEELHKEEAQVDLEVQDACEVGDFIAAFVAALKCFIYLKTVTKVFLRLCNSSLLLPLQIEVNVKEVQGVTVENTGSSQTRQVGN